MKTRTAIVGIAAVLLVFALAGTLAAAPAQVDAKQTQVEAKQTGAACSVAPACSDAQQPFDSAGAPACQDPGKAGFSEDVIGMPTPIRLCSGDDCGCYEPTCAEECAGQPLQPCMQICRQAQIDCAIECCSW